MKSLDAFKHRSIFSTDQNFLIERRTDPGSLTDPKTGLKTLGQSIANGAFHIVKNESQFLWSVMNYFQKEFSPNLWSSGGSDIVTKAFKGACNIKPHEYGYRQITGEDGTQNLKMNFNSTLAAPKITLGLYWRDENFYFYFPNKIIF